MSFWFARSFVGGVPNADHIGRQFCVAISWHIYKTARMPQTEKIDVPSSARRFRGTSKALSVCKSIYCAGFSNVGAAGDRDFLTDRRWHVSRIIK